MTFFKNIFFTGDVAIRVSMLCLLVSSLFLIIRFIYINTFDGSAKIIYPVLLSLGSLILFYKDIFKDGDYEVTTRVPIMTINSYFQHPRKGPGVNGDLDYIESTVMAKALPNYKKNQILPDSNADHFGLFLLEKYVKEFEVSLNEVPAESRMTRRAELIEEIFYDWYSKKHSSSWLMEIVDFKLPSGNSKSFLDKGQAYGKTTIDIASILKDDLARTQLYTVELNDKMILPPKTTFKRTFSKNNIYLELKTPYVLLEITIYYKMMNTVEKNLISYNNLVEKFYTNFDESVNSLKFNGVLTSFKYTVVPEKRFSKESKDNQKWATQLVSDFKKDFDWNNLYTKLIR